MTARLDNTESSFLLTSILNLQVAPFEVPSPGDVQLHVPMNVNYGKKAIDLSLLIVMYFHAGKI